MRNHYPLVTAHTALAAYKKITQLYEHTPQPTNEQRDHWKAEIDKAAAEMMEQKLHEIPFRTIKVGSEGDKEIHYAGKAAASVKGAYGKDHHPIVEGVSDVVEGTTPASRREPGASSVIAVARKENNKPFGIRPTPKDTHYLIKFIAPPQAHGSIDLAKPHEENLRTLIKTLGISPAELTQITLDPSKPGREINTEYLAAAEKLGVTIKLISGGDFMAGVRATMDPIRFGVSPVILVGRGGYEEGIMAGAAARALGAFMQAKEFHLNPTILANNPVLTLERHLVPADPEDILVSTSFITDDPWFTQPGIGLHEERNKITTMVISTEGMRFEREFI